MKKAKAHYLKIVEWSEEDRCYVGQAPGLILGGVHGPDEKKVFRELCALVKEAMALLEKEGRPLPPPLPHKNYSGRVLLRIPSSLHKALAIKAMQQGESLNKLIQFQLMKSPIL